MRPVPRSREDIVSPARDERDAPPDVRAATGRGVDGQGASDRGDPFAHVREAGSRAPSRLDVAADAVVDDLEAQLARFLSPGAIHPWARSKVHPRPDHAIGVWNLGRTGTTMPGSMSARVLIVDDQRAFRKAARGLLELRGYMVVGEAGDAAAAMDLGTRLLPDAVLLDVRLGKDDGFAVARALVRACPGAAVLLVSCDDHRHKADEVAASGARGFLLKSRLAVADLGEFWPATGVGTRSPS